MVQLVCSLTSCVWARFPDRFPLCPDSDHGQAYSDLVRSRVYVWLGLVNHLHFWRNDRVLLRATAVTRGWKGHRIRVSTKKLTLAAKGNCQDAATGTIRTRNLSSRYQMCVSRPRFSLMHKLPSHGLVRSGFCRSFEWYVRLAQRGSKEKKEERKKNRLYNMKSLGNK